jgi:hypothetical protein
MKQLALILLAAGSLMAADAPAPAPAKPAPPAAPVPAQVEPLVCAALPCEAGSVEVEALARALPDLLATALGRDPRFSLVERQRLDRVLGEQALGASGLADPATAAQIGRLVGAQALLLSRVYRVETQTFATVRLVHVESGRVRVVTKSTSERKPSAQLLAGMVAEELKAIPGTDLVSAAPDEDAELKAILAELSKAIGDQARPTVCVVVPEEHLRRTVPDPAVKTELTYLLRKLRFRVLENDSPLLDQWVKDQFAGKAANFPAELGAVQVVIYGGAFAETVGNAANLVSVRARIELNAISVANGEILAVAAKHEAGADLTEQVAGKAALTKAARAAARAFLPDLVSAWATPEAARKP